MAVPVVESFTSGTSLSSGAVVTVAKPAGLATGDLCLVFASADTTTAGASYVDKTGWTRVKDFGAGGTIDDGLAIFWRIADGTEGATEGFTENGTGHDLWAYWIRVSGVDTTTPFHVFGAETLIALSPAEIASATTTIADCLAFYVLTFDGGDQTSFSVAGAGWSESSEINAGTGASNNSGCWGTKNMASAGATGPATISVVTNNDSSASIIFAIAPTGGAPATRFPGTLMMGMG